MVVNVRTRVGMRWVVRNPKRTFLNGHEVKIYCLDRRRRVMRGYRTDPEGNYILTPDRKAIVEFEIRYSKRDCFELRPVTIEEVREEARRGA